MTIAVSPLQAVASAVAVALALTATGSTQEQQGKSLSVTFDGDRCTVDGPSQLRSDDVVLEAANGTARAIEVMLVRIDRGHTLDDLVEHLTPSPSRVGPPPFIRPVDGTPAGPGRIETRALSPLPNGDYAVVCLEYLTEVRASNPTAYPALRGPVTITGQCSSAGTDRTLDLSWRPARPMPAPPR